jgi:hypothetical protein
MAEEPALIELTIGFSALPDFVNTPADEFYLHVTKNVKSTFVNLKALRFEGGYIYRSGNEVSFLLDKLRKGPKIKKGPLDL